MARVSNFRYDADGQLCCEEVRVCELGSFLESTVHRATPFFVYSERQIRSNISGYREALGSVNLGCSVLGYALKANANLHLLDIIRQEGCWAVTVSGNEMKMAATCGFQPSNIIYNGNGKESWEIDSALTSGCLLNVDSHFDARNIGQRASALQKVPSVLIRVNPNLDANVHPYNSTAMKDSKFGVGPLLVESLVDELTASCPGALVVGLHGHIGSTVKDVGVYRDVAKALVGVADCLRASGRGDNLKYLNLGGGLGIAYDKEADDQDGPWELVKAVAPVVEGTGLQLILEPGRSIIGDAALLVARVIGVKSDENKKFVVTTAAMTENIRPALYSAYHHITLVNLKQRDCEVEEVFDIVGPVCESGDFLGKDRKLPRPSEGSLLAVWDVGAYCSSMSSNYNMRCRPAEICVSGNRWAIVRRPETLQDLLRPFPTQLTYNDKKMSPIL